MNPETIFSLSGPTAVAGWLLLIVAPRARWSQRIVMGLPLVLAGIYLMLIALHWGEGKGGFSSLAAVEQFIR